MADIPDQPDPEPTPDTNTNTHAGDEGEHDIFIQNLRHSNPQDLIAAFLRQHRGPVSPIFRRVLSAARSFDVASFLRYIISPEFRRSLWNTVKRNKWSILFLCLGILLLCNPLAILGFGAQGVVAGSFAAWWQSTMGGIVIAEFAVLQSIGATWAPVILPALRAKIVRNAVGNIVCDVLDVGNRAKRWWRSFWGENNGEREEGDDREGEEEGHEHVE
ncbi:hypothetical protein BDD12DRAFT_885893 [Trichophaea hybrida]|nr:hypothetical protein BDD12DRAFT_885893 [Trichophaea hybrida]